MLGICLLLITFPSKHILKKIFIEIMNLFSTSVMMKSAYFLFPSQLFRINSSRLLNSDVRCLSYYQRPFCPISGTASTFNVTGSETVPNRASYSQGRMRKLVEYVTHKFDVISRVQDRSKLALLLYRTIDTIHFDEFYRFLELPDTFNSWFVIMELHVWMLMTQVMDNQKSGIKLRNEIIQILWIDVEERLNNMGYIKKKILKKQLKELHGRLGVTLLLYDEGLLSTDIVLAGAIWYKFFDKHCNDPVKLELLVRYVRHQIQHLSILNIRDYEAAKKIKNIWEPFSNNVKAVLEV